MPNTRKIETAKRMRARGKSLREIGEYLEVSHETARKLTAGVPFPHVYVPLPDEAIALLGTKPDADIAAQFNRTVGVVAHARNRRGIPAIPVREGNCLVKCVCQPIAWWKAFERAAKAEGLTLSSWVGHCCNAAITEELSHPHKRTTRDSTTPVYPDSPRRNLVQPEDWWKAWRRAAKACGMNMSSWIGERCKDRLPEKKRNRLPKREKAGGFRVSKES